jgi:hypothetical protein
VERAARVEPIDPERRDGALRGVVRTGPPLDLQRHLLALHVHRGRGDHGARRDVARSHRVGRVGELRAGPYDSSQSAVAPLGIDRFDASRALHSFATIAELHFTRDFHKTIDSFGVGLFNAVQTANIIYPDGMTADNDALLAGSFPMDYATVAKASRTMDLLNIPYFPNGKRIMVLTVLQCEQLTRDPEFQRLAVFEKDYNPLYRGSYVGSVGQVDILKSTTLTTSSNSSSVAVQYGQMFGPGMVGVGPADMPRVVPNTQDNYGENSLAIWLWYCAFGVLDDSFGLSIRTA